MQQQQWYYTDTPVYPLGGLLLFVVFVVVVIVWVSWFVPYNPWGSYYGPYSFSRDIQKRVDEESRTTAVPPGQSAQATKAMGGSYNPSWARGSTVGDGDMHQMLMSRITIDGFFKKT